jgi:cytochrome c5
VMNAARLFGILGAAVSILGTAAAQRPELPAGPNREVVSRECQACHDLSMVFAAAGMSREGWDALMDEMTSYGMNITKEERAKIVDYLATNLGPR